MFRGRLSTIVANIVLAVVVTCLCFVTLEVGLRLVDGYRLDRLTLEGGSATPERAAADGVDATRYAKKVRLDPTFDLAWFHSSPRDYDRLPKYEPPAEWIKAVANYRPSPSEPPFVKDEFKFLYNYNWLVEACSTGKHSNVIRHYKTFPGFVYAFAGPDGSIDPPYRTVPRGWGRVDYYNNFGFRGPDIVPRKSGRVIRIAFLGSSVTAGGPDLPFTYPEYAIHYLRQWAEANKLDVDFDLINAARVGSSSTIIAKIMRYEVAPFHPDIVVYYEGGRDLRADSVVEEAGAETDEPSKFRFSDKYLSLEQHSAFVSRLNQLFRYGSGEEHAKPPHALTFDLIQKDPDIDRNDLPFRLHEQISDVRDVADATRSIGAEFFLASFVAIVGEGLRLDPVRHRQILKILNEEYAPMTYREIRQSLDFENTVYRKLSQIDNHPFLDVDRYFPQDPDLFEDMIHLSSADSFRLMGWIFAQELTPYLRAAIESGKLPKPAYDPDPQAIAWASQQPIKFDLSCLP
jgi:hypothetical protein